MRQVLAFADMGDSDDSEGEADEEPSAAFSHASHRAPPAPAPPAPAPPPATLRPIRVAPPKAEAAAPRSSFTPTVRGLHGDGDSTPERVSPTSVLPPPRTGGLAPAVYTYFDKDAGTLVTAAVPRATPAPVLVLRPGAESEDDGECEWDAPDRSFVARPLPPPAPPAPVVAPAAAAAPVQAPLAESAAPPARRAHKPASRKRRGGGGGLFLTLLASALGVGVAVAHKEQLAAAAQATQAALSARLESAQRARAAAAAAAAAAKSAAAAAASRIVRAPPAMLHTPAAAQRPSQAAAEPPLADAASPPLSEQPAPSEWQPRAGTRRPNAPPPSEAPDAWHPGAMRTREVRWQPHVSLGRG